MKIASHISLPATDSHGSIITASPLVTNRSYGPFGQLCVKLKQSCLLGDRVPVRRTQRPLVFLTGRQTQGMEARIKETLKMSYDHATIS